MNHFCRKTIVAKGTLLATLYKDANSETIVRRGYGIVQDIPSENIRDPSRKTEQSEHDGIRYVKNCVRWFFRAVSSHVNPTHMAFC